MWHVRRVIRDRGTLREAYGNDCPLFSNFRFYPLQGDSISLISETEKYGVHPTYVCCMYSVLRTIFPDIKASDVVDRSQPWFTSVYPSTPPPKIDIVHTTIPSRYIIDFYFYDIDSLVTQLRWFGE